MGSDFTSSCNDDNCDTCYKKNHNCVVCKNNKYSHNGVCVLNCPRNTYIYINEKDGKMFLNCYQNCDSCSGEGNANNMNCLTCSTNHIKYKRNCYEIYDNKIKSFYAPEDRTKITSCLQYHNKYIIENTNQCIDRPLNGYFISNSITGLLSPCHQNCETCSTNYTSSNTNCDTCKSSTLDLKDGNCLHDCPEGYYQNEKYCLKCHANCQICAAGMITDSNGNLKNMKCITCKNHLNINNISVSIEFEEGNKNLSKYIKNEENCFPLLINEESKIIFDISEINPEKKNGSCLMFNKTIYSGKFECIPKPENTFYVLDNDENTGVIKNCSLACETCIGESNGQNTNCLKCAKGYYKTEDSKTNCIINNLIPKNYYLNSIDDIYYKCHPNCYNCSNGYASDNMNCITCTNNYYFIYGTNKSNCYNITLLNKGYYLKDNFFYPCDDNCLTCSEGKNITSNNCLSCDNENNLYLLEDLNTCKFSNYSGYYLDNNTKNLKKCHYRCKTCKGPYENNIEANIENHNCIECADNFYNLPNGSYPSNCYDNATIDSWYKEFVEFSTNNLEFKGYISTNEIDISTITINEETTNKIINEDIINVEKETTNKTKDDIITNITDLMKDKEIGINYEIKGEDFTIIIKPTNSPPLPNTTHVDFDECENVLRKEYNMSNTSIITFLQMEINNDDKNSLYNQIIYTTYNDQLEELDLSVCKDIQTQIHYALKDAFQIIFPNIFCSRSSNIPFIKRF